MAARPHATDWLAKLPPEPGPDRLGRLVLFGVGGWFLSGRRLVLSGSAAGGPAAGGPSVDGGRRRPMVVGGDGDGDRSAWPAAGLVGRPMCRYRPAAIDEAGPGGATPGQDADRP